MLNYRLCDQFHARMSVVVLTCTVSSNVKGNPGSKVNGGNRFCPFALNACLLESDTNKTGRAIEDKPAHFVFCPM